VSVYCELEGMNFSKPCIVCGVVTKDSRCDEHKLLDKRPSTVNRASVNSKAIRRRTLHRDRYRCSNCGIEDKSGETLEADHIISLARGGDHALRNMTTLCKTCHLVKTQAESKDRFDRS